MEVVYLDQVFAVNVLVDYCIVLAAARMSAAVLRRGRYLLAALAGGLYAAMTVLPGLSWMALAPVKAAAGIGMALIAFGGERRFWRCTAVLFGTAALFGGAVFALSAASGTQPGQALRRVTWRILIPTFALCYAVIVTVFRRRLQSVSRRIVPAEVTIRGQRLSLRALYDTGNALRDPASGASVAVVCAAALEPVLGALPRDPASAFMFLRERADGARLLPFSAVGTEGGLLPAIRPERLTVCGTELPYLLAVAPAPVSPDGEYEMLLPAE